MRRLMPLLYAIAALSGCQTNNDGLATGSEPSAISGLAASAIAGDMASRFAEQLGPAGATAIKMNKGMSDYGLALEAALRGWGFTVVTDPLARERARPIELAYSIDSIDGLVLARLSTPSIALGRAYNATEAGAAPSSPLSIMRKN